VAEHRVTDNDLFDNKLIFGDNLLALKALEQELTGKVKCVFIDPPYNTGSAFEHYDDGLEHSLWLTMMRDRLELLKTMLSDDGSIWISIDDNEMPYLRILMDEVFGRNNFVDTVVWQKIYTTKNSAKYFSGMHDYILVYAKEKDKLQINQLERDSKQDAAYRNLDNDPRGPWKATPMHARNYYSAGRYAVTSPSGNVIDGPPTGTYWRVSEETFLEMMRDNKIWWGRDGNGVPSQKRFLTDVKQGVIPATLWFYSEAGHNGEAKNEIRALFPNEDDIFITPKPEKLLQRIIQLATNPGDIVLDSFAGSGTTGAVAHKMGRRWVMVELQETAHTHIIPRLRKVIDGTDQGGISESVGWKGGGGFRYYKLAPSVLAKDKWDNWVVNPSFNAEMLSEAMCKLEGFTYAPSDSVYWLHGYSTERDFIYVTTQHLSLEQLQSISDDVGSERSLLILCSAYRASAEMFSNLTIKKIPQAVLHKCEWGKDDYSLKVENLPKAPETQPEPEAVLAKLKTNRNQASLFDGGND
jgi:adenine-specific DNA-methyltransferase